METTTSARKAAALGMPWGTAANRLRKLVMMDLLERLGANCCYVCGEAMDAGTLTIEHKEPWFEIDPALFWDLSNIAFSHRRCNRPHRARGGPPLRHGAAGMYKRGCRCDECVAYRRAKRQRDSRPGAGVVTEQAATL